MFYALNILIYALVFLIGAVVFSYLHIIIERLPKKENILIRYTACENCGHEQHAKDVFPIFSWIAYGGKCVYCHEKRPKRGLFTELLGGALAICCLAFYGLTVQSLFTFLVLCDLAVISLIDFDTQEIPPVLNLILLLLAIPSYFIIPGATLIERAIGIVAVSLPMLLLLILMNGFGGGDVKLMAAAGALLGWKATVVAFFIGAIGGGIYGGYLLATKKKGRKGYFAFGPFLCVGIAIAMIQNFGTNLMQMYIDYIFSFRSIY